MLWDHEYRAHLIHTYISINTEHIWNHEYRAHMIHTYEHPTCSWYRSSCVLSSSPWSMSECFTASCSCANASWYWCSSWSRSAIACLATAWAPSASACACAGANVLVQQACLYWTVYMQGRLCRAIHLWAYTSFTGFICWKLELCFMILLL